MPVIPALEVKREGEGETLIAPNVDHLGLQGMTLTKEKEEGEMKNVIPITK